MNTLPETLLNDGDPARPTLVCIPGAMCSPRVFASCAKSSGLRAVALHWLETDGPHDLDSIAARVAAHVVEPASRMPRAILVGHSLGTPLAVLAAVRIRANGASRVDGLILSNSGANTRGHGDADALVERIRTEWAQPFWDAFVARCFHRLPQGDLLDAVRAYPSQVDKQAVIDAIRSQQATDLLPVLGALSDVPTAVVHGKYDVARPIEHARELSGAIPGSTLHVLDTGHTSCAEAPDAFAAIIRGIASDALAI
jgi:3-oxoadipate enol-lactonase